jgi:hypothetical protein
MNSNQTACQGVSGLLFGHKFKARYSTHSTPHFAPNAVELAKRTDLPQIIEQSQDRVDSGEEFDVLAELCSNESIDEEIKTYHGDVCTRCGLVVNQPK